MKVLSKEKSFLGRRKAPATSVAQFEKRFLCMVRLFNCLFSSWCRNRSTDWRHIERLTFVVHVGEAKDIRENRRN